MDCLRLGRSFLCLGQWPFFCHRAKSLGSDSTWNTVQSFWVQAQGWHCCPELRTWRLCWKQSLGSGVHLCCSMLFHTVPASSGNRTQAQIPCILGPSQEDRKYLHIQRQVQVCHTPIPSRHSQRGCNVPGPVLGMSQVRFGIKPKPPTEAHQALWSDPSHPLTPFSPLSNTPTPTSVS